MSIIKSTSSDRRIIITEPEGDAEHLNVCIDTDVVGGLIQVRRADLHAALGIDELGCGCDEADANLKAAIQRAEDAEAESLEQAKLVRMWADRAEKAEAIIERARELLPVTLRAALNSSPALPTWSGALIVVEGLPAEDGPVTLTLHDDGRWYYLSGTSYYPADRVARADWKLAHITTA